jgi:putative Mg2+ transporter-C (MgtC) family protein
MGVVLLQVVVAALLGAAIGVERELNAQPAGLRTHILVSLGAALFTLAGTQLLRSDPTRIAAQVVTGIGFLGGGAIFREGLSIRGLTTAASLWVTAAVGLAVGLRGWVAAAATTVLALAVLWLVKVFERGWLPLRRILLVTLTLEAGAPMDEVERRAVTTLPRSTVLRVIYAHDNQMLELSARAGTGASLPELAEQMRLIPGVLGVELSR